MTGVQITTAVTVPLLNVRLTPTMANHLLKARSYDGRTWIFYGRSQTIVALERRGLVDQRYTWEGRLTEEGVKALSYLMGCVHLGWTR